MADRIVTNTILESNGNTLFLVNKSENWSPRHVNEAIIDIENNIHEYYVDNLSTKIGVVIEGGNKFLRTFRDNNLGNNLDTIEDGSVYLPEFIKDYPDNKETSWNHKLQGVTHSQDHWFFTQLEKIHKFHISLDLDSDDPTLTVDMPSNLSDDGYDHFGDPEYYTHNGNGYLFIPVERKNGKSRPLVAVFRDENPLEFIGTSILTKQPKKAGWLAINPNNNILYSSNSGIKDKNPVYRYEINFDQLEQGEVEKFEEFQDDENIKGELVLYKQDRTNIFEIDTYIQGGCFTPNGILCIAYGKTYFPDDLKTLAIAGSILSLMPGGILGGILGAISGAGLAFLKEEIFKNTEDNALVGMSLFNSEGIHIHTSSRVNKPFKYEVHPVIPDAQEVEGICYWDLDNPNNQSNNIEGNIHAILLNKNAGDIQVFGGIEKNDKFWFKHFRI
jgi:hypothetical protein